MLIALSSGSFYSTCIFFYAVSSIALVKVLFSIQKYCYFSYFSMKTYVVGTH